MHAAQLFILVASIAGVAAAPGEANCSSNWPGSVPRVIVTSGHGEVQVSPDTATIVVNFHATSNLSEGGSAANATVTVAGQGADFLAHLDDQGIAPANITQTQFSSSERLDWGTGTSVLVGFEAHNAYEIRLSNLSGVAAVVTAANDAGGSIGGTSFVVSPSLAASSRLAALTLASSNARDRATAMATGIGAGVGAARSISEAGAAPPSPFFRPRAVYAFDSSAPSMRVSEEAFASEGLATVSADVNVEFDLK
jgi:uncharacterized protein YggE